MSPLPDRATALERAADQLVDEIALRRSALVALMPAHLDDGSPHDPIVSFDALRAHAGVLVAELTGFGARRRAAAIVGDLWPQCPPADIPHWWWSTPLGMLIDGVLRPAPTWNQPPGSARLVAVGGTGHPGRGVIE